MMHGNICNAYQVHDVDELKQHRTKMWRGLGQIVVDDAIYEWYRCLWACVHVRGVHFEH